VGKGCSFPCKFSALFRATLNQLFYLVKRRNEDYNAAIL
jgi:hypothetical protein